MPLYHVTTSDWQVDDIIEPGEWGRKLRVMRPGGPWPNDLNTLLWELALETSRKAVAPSKPSRLDCVFTCEHEVFGRRFAQQFRTGGKVLEVEPVSETAPTHRGDFFMLTKPRTPWPPYVDYMSEDAAAYWLSEPREGFAEVIVGGPIRVLQVLPPTEASPTS